MRVAQSNDKESNSPVRVNGNSSHLNDGVVEFFWEPINNPNKGYEGFNVEFLYEKKRI